MGQELRWLFLSDLGINERDLQKLFKKLDTINSKLAVQSSTRACNVIGQRTIGQTAKAASRDLKVAQKHVRKRLKLARANWRYPYSKLYLYPQDIPIIGTAKAPDVIRRGLGGQTPLKVGKHSVDGGYVNVIRKTGHWHVMKRKTKQRRPVEVVKLPLSEVAPKYFYPIATRLMKQQWAQIFVDDFAYRVKRLSEK